MADKYRALVDALFVSTPRCELALALMDPGVTKSEATTTAADRVAHAAAAYGASDHVLRCAMAADIAATKAPDSLWRTNSGATRLFASLLRSPDARTFLRHTVQPAVSRICADDGASDVCTVAQGVVDRAFAPGAVHMIPVSLRRALATAREESERRFPKSRHVAVGGLAMLRYMAPAAASPQGWGILDGLGPEITLQLQRDTVRRALVQLSTILQKLASGLTSRDAASADAVSYFVSANFGQFVDFVERLTSVDTIPDSSRPLRLAPGPEASSPELVDDLAALHALLEKFADPAREMLAKTLPAGTDAAALVAQALATTVGRSVSPSTSPLAEDEEVAALRKGVREAVELAVARSEKIYRAARLKADEETRMRKAAEDAAELARRELAEARRELAETRRELAELKSKAGHQQQQPLVHPSSPAPADLMQAALEEDGDPRKTELMERVVGLSGVLAGLTARLASKEDINDAIIVAKLARELHSLAQLPISKVYQVKPLQKQITMLNTPEAWEKAKPVCKAATKALEEVRAQVEQLSREAVPVLPLYDIERRLTDIHILLQQAPPPPTAASLRKSH